MKSIIVVTLLILFSSTMYCQKLQTTAVSKAYLYTLPGTTSPQRSFYGPGDTVFIDRYVNGFWQVYDTFVGIPLYYISDSLLNQTPAMDSIKRFAHVVLTNAEAEFFRKKEMEDMEQKELTSRIKTAISKNIPLVFLSGYIELNSIGTPEVTLYSSSYSKETIDAYTVSIYCYNNFNEPVNHYSSGSNIFKGISQEKIDPYDKTDGHTWILYGYDQTRKVKIYLVKVHFVSGKTWIIPDKKLMMLDVKYN